MNPLGTSSLKKLIDASTDRQLKDECEKIESGKLWAEFGIENVFERDLFSWYLNLWSDDIAQMIRNIALRFDEYDPETLSVAPVETRDLLKKLYHKLLPRSVRHDLGEFYTPDWLAEYVLDELGYDGNPDKRILDPACGSGTFLIMAINRIKKWYQKHRFEAGFGPGELFKKILNNVIGFDLNPLAVTAARTNYLLACRDLLRTASRVEIPVYLCDSILTPSEYGGLFKDARKLSIAALEEPLRIPVEVSNSRENLSKYTSEIEFCVENDYTADEFLGKIKAAGLPVGDEAEHINLYNTLVRLKKEGKNGIWAKIIKNAFAPLFIKKVDYVAGNPPWVNWEYLPDEYRDSTKALWTEYGLFSLSGHEARLGGGKKDLSMIFTYSSVDNYLKDGGKLGFVITQSVFKTKGAGDGFRRFEFEKDNRKVYIVPLRVSDMSDFQPFEDATNRTAVFVCEKSKQPVKYPVPYLVWKKTVRGKISPDLPLDEVKKRVKIIEMGAVPVDPEQPTSPWLTAPTKALPAIHKVIGKSDYEAHAGVYTGGTNGVYWIEVIKERPDGNLFIRNLANVGKIKVKQAETVIEPDFVYPLLRGRDVQRWCAKPSCHIIMVQDPVKRIGYPEREMKIKYPRTYAYLKQFEDVLQRRAAYMKYFSDKAPFYTIYDVGPYTMAKWKVVWKDMGKCVASAVIARDEKGDLILPEHHVMFVSVNDEDEAYYISAVLNSSCAGITSWAYTTSYGKSTHIVDHIKVPRFDPSNEIHLRLAELSRMCHEAAEKDDEEQIKQSEREIDRLAAQIWGITKEELENVWAALEEI